MGTDTDFRALFEAAPGLYLVLTPKYRIVAVSDAYLAATMTDRAEILGRDLFDVFPDNPDDPAATGTRNLRESLDRVRAGRVADTMAVQKYDIRRPESQGGGFEERFWSPVNSPVLAADGSLAYIIHRVEDVTAFVRLKQRDAVHEQVEVELKTRAAAMEGEVYLRAQQVQEANREIRRLNEELERRVEERTAELRRTEEKLLHAQKMEAVARLTGGIAHDFNNMLTVIVSYATLVLDALEPESALRADVEQIRAAGERASTLTRQLLTFSRQQVVRPRLLDLNATVRELEGMLRRLIGESIELRTFYAPDLGSVLADPSQVDQVLANLVVNARDAMPQGGRLTIETGAAMLEPARDESAVEGARPHVLLAVSDTGVGMDAATRQRIFEPFFTTKEVGRGTGLGLSTVYGIVEQAGGQIWVYSEPGRGTTFKIYLPRVDAAAAVEEPESVDVRASADGETLLLVEDDPLVRMAALAVLRRNGYRVHVAADAEEALRLFADSGEEIRLVLTDLVMPGMSGRELADRLLAVAPSLRMIFMSGYTGHTLDDGALPPTASFLPKPFVPAALLRAVRSRLDESR